MSRTRRTGRWGELWITVLAAGCFTLAACGFGGGGESSLPDPTRFGVAGQVQDPCSGRDADIFRGAFPAPVMICVGRFGVSAGTQPEDDPFLKGGTPIFGPLRLEPWGWENPQSRIIVGNSDGFVDSDSIVVGGVYVEGSLLDELLALGASSADAAALCDVAVRAVAQIEGSTFSDMGELCRSSDPSREATAQPRSTMSEQEIEDLQEDFIAEAEAEAQAREDSPPQRAAELLADAVVSGSESPEVAATDLGDWVSDTRALLSSSPPTGWRYANSEDCTFMTRFAICEIAFESGADSTVVELFLESYQGIEAPFGWETR